VRTYRVVSYGIIVQNVASWDIIPSNSIMWDRLRGDKLLLDGLLFRWDYLLVGPCPDGKMRHKFLYINLVGKTLGLESSSIFLQMYSCILG
jgi:hypothetical protein